MTGVNFSGRVTASGSRGLPDSGSVVLSLLEPCMGPGSLEGGLGFPGPGSGFTSYMRQGLGSTPRETRCRGRKRVRFPELSPTVRLTLHAMGISVLGVHKSPPSGAHLSPLLSSRPTGPTSSWASWLTRPTDTSNSIPSHHQLPTPAAPPPVFPSSVNDTSNPTPRFKYPPDSSFPH